MEHFNDEFAPHGASQFGSSVSREFLQQVCDPCFEHMLTSYGDDLLPLGAEPAGRSASRELLRQVCEPFWGQMLVAMQSALQNQQQFQDHWGQPHHDYSAAKKTEGASNQSAEHMVTMPFQGLMRNLPKADGAVRQRGQDEESTETDECSAFATLFSCTSSEGNGCDSLDEQRHVLEAPPNQPLTNASLEVPVDSDKSVMVCRHWKAKGWCRLESSCKFQHPDNKRGTKVPKSGPNAGSKAACPGIATDSLSSDVPVPLAIGAGRRTRKSRARCAEKQKRVAGTDELLQAHHVQPQVEPVATYASVI